MYGFLKYILIVMIDQNTTVRKLHHHIFDKKKWIKISFFNYITTSKKVKQFQIYNILRENFNCYDPTRKFTYGFSKYIIIVMIKIHCEKITSSYF